MIDKNIQTVSEAGSAGRISYDELVRAIRKMLRRGYGYTEKEAELTAQVLVEADARGIPSHGVSRLAFYRRNLDGGHARPGQEPEIVWQTPCSLVVDGHGGIGSYISDWCVDKMLEQVKNCGTSYCAVRNSNHFGIAGWWSEKLARHGMIGLAFTNTLAAGTPTFGRERMLGTNPIAVAIPEADGRIFSLDMATTTVAHGRVEVYARRNRSMPLGWVVGEDGLGTTDAATFDKIFYTTKLGGHLYLGGEGEEFGGHKGYGLGLLVELLCSGLSLGMSSARAYAPSDTGQVTHFFGAMRLDLFGQPEEIEAHVGSILQDIRNSEKTVGQERIYTHGEKESEARAKSLREGVYVDEATKKYLAELADEFGLPELKPLLKS